MSIFDSRRSKLLYGVPAVMVALAWAGVGGLVVMARVGGWIGNVGGAVFFVAAVCNVPLIPLLPFIHKGSDNYGPLSGDPLTVSVLSWLLWHAYVRLALLFWSLRGTTQIRL